MSGSIVYAGGGFTSIGGQARNDIASLDATTGTATAWDPNADGIIHALAVSGSAVYAGGYFDHIGGQARNNIAALDVTTGAASAWDPNPSAGMECREPGVCPYRVFALFASSSTIYVGGEFAIIGGLSQSGIAAIGDVTTPTLLSLVSAEAAPGLVRLTWLAADSRVPRATVYRRAVAEGWGVLGEVSADGTGRLVYEDTHVVAGEHYGYRLGVLLGDAEEFMGETWVDVPRTPELTLGGLRPNPASNGLTVAFSLPDAAPARLELLDLAGRRMIVRDVGALGGGSHVVALAEERAIAPGFYLLRIVRDGRALTARAIVVR